MRSSNTVFETGTRQSNGVRILVAFALAIASLTLSQQAPAMQASPHPIVDEQPDGSPVEVYMRGDERRHWMEDREGFTVVLNDGWFVYGRSDKRGRLVPTRFRVGRDDPRRTSLRRGVRPPQGFSGAGGSGAAAAEVEPEAVPPPTGSLANLVVLLRFSNHANRGVPTQAEIDTLFNSQGVDPC